MHSIRDHAQAALRLAMRDRDQDALIALRGLIAAWDNATARSDLPTPASSGLRVGVGAADVVRRQLEESELLRIAQEEIAEHQTAVDAAEARGDEMTRSRLTRQIATLRALTARYVGGSS